MLVEERLIAYLTNMLDVEVFAERPKTKELPTSYILLEKTGGGKEDHINLANIAIQSISTSLYSAAKLNDTVIRVMTKLYGQPGIFSCEYDTDYNFTDTATKEYRYQALFNVKYY